MVSVIKSNCDSADVAADDVSTTCRPYVCLTLESLFSIVWVNFVFCLSARQLDCAEIFGGCAAESEGGETLSAESSLLSLVQ